MNNTSNTTAADLPPAPNGHGVSNSTRQVDAEAEGTTKDAPSSKKKKKKKGRQHNQKPASTRSESTAAATTADQPPPAEPAGPQPSIEEPTVPTAAPIEESAAAPIEQPAAAPIEVPVESLRLRMKVWTDQRTSKRYLMPSAFMRDIVKGQPVTDVMYAYAMRDDDTQIVTLTATEWNALPFYYFQEDGPAPRASARPVDVL